MEPRPSLPPALAKLFGPKPGASAATPPTPPKPLGFFLPAKAPTGAATSPETKPSPLGRDFFAMLAAGKAPRPTPSIDVVAASRAAAVARPSPFALTQGPTAFMRPAVSTPVGLFGGIERAGKKARKKSEPKAPSAGAKSLKSLLGLDIGDYAPNSKVADAHRRAGVPDSGELARILEIPRRPSDLTPYESGGPKDLTSVYRRPGGTMSLWPIQNAALHEAPRVGGLLGPIGVGHGKAAISLLLPAAMKARLAVILIPPSLRDQTMSQVIPQLSKEFFLPLANLRIVAYSEISNHRSADILEELKPDLIIADECFPYETLIVTNTGRVPIGDVVENGTASHVLAFNKGSGSFEWRAIARRLRRESTKTLVRVTHALGAFTCTEDHKVWTEDSGYVVARDLVNKDVRFLRDGVQFHGQGSVSGYVPEGVLSAMQPAARNEDRSKESSRLKVSGYVRTYDSEQPVSSAGGRGEDGSSETRETFPDDARRERAPNTPSSATSRNPWVAYGVFGIDENDPRNDRSYARQLQDRHSGSGSFDSNRGGRRKPQWTEGTYSRCEENARSESSRVARVEIFEQAGSSRPGRCGGTGAFVYDLEVEGLHNYIADGVVVSNCHNLKNRGAARTKRFLRYMKEHPECRFVGLSGTITRKSLKDYQHLSELALKNYSPLPRSWSDLNDWSEAIDVSDDPMPPGALRKFCTPEECSRLDDPENGSNEVKSAAAHEAVRSGFRRRLVETPGVVATEEGALGTSLVLHGLRPLVPTIVRDALERLRYKWEIAGEELTNALDVSRVGRQLASGFYYKWVWPREIRPDGTPDNEWLEARAAWHKEIREVLKRSIKGMDSPLLVTRAVHEGKFRSESWEAWRVLKERYAHLPGAVPPRESVWLSEYLVDAAHAWIEKNATKTEPIICWFGWTELGEKLAARGGYPFFGGGPNASRDLAVINVKKTPVIVASIKAHGTGKNLQMFSRNLILNTPSAGAEYEQLLARTHRPGQEADEVSAHIFLHTLELEDAFKGALNDARYIESTSGQKSKLNYARRVGC